MAVCERGRDEKLFKKSVAYFVDDPYDAVFRRVDAIVGTCVCFSGSQLRSGVEGRCSATTEQDKQFAD